MQFYVHILHVFSSNLQSLAQPHAVREDATVPVGPLAPFLQLGDVDNEVVVHELDALHLRACPVYGGGEKAQRGRRQIRK